jgi:hypothetical protein
VAKCLVFDIYGATKVRVAKIDEVIWQAMKIELIWRCKLQEQGGGGRMIIQQNKKTTN